MTQRAYYNGAMRPHYHSLSETKQQYREIFRDAQNRLSACLRALLPEDACPICDEDASLPERASGTIDPWLAPLHADCGYRTFQQRALDFLENEIGRGIVEQLQRIETERNQVQCGLCGMCCRLASSEDSYAQLRQRAEAGDDFARQFVSVFLPYESREAARRKFPDVVAAVLREAGEAEAPGDEEPVYFYHCPYIGEDNRCTIYGTGKRPPMCERYPETPLVFVYEHCAWRGWKDRTHPDALTVHAMTELALHWAGRLRVALAE